MCSETFSILSPIGTLTVSIQGKTVIGINLGMDSRKAAPECLQATDNPTSSFGQQVATQLKSYFACSAADFSLELCLSGTPFQRAVWQQIRGIKYGETRSYSDIAGRLGSSARAVGNACRANPVPIIIPCHRVVAKSGLGGFAGQREGRNIEAKTWLLQHEQTVGLHGR